MSKKVGMHTCLGVFACPLFGNGCHFRERPRAPRRGENKYNPDGDPSAKNKCCLYDLELDRYGYNCKWIIQDNADDHWLLMHQGSHNHPVPQLAGVTDGGKETLEDYLTVCPGINPADLAAGTPQRDPISTIDPKFHNRDALRSQKRAILKNSISRQRICVWDKGT